MLGDTKENLMKNVIDSHVHCGRYQGRTFEEPRQDFEMYYGLIKSTPIRGAVMFPPVMEVYNRYDPLFQDSEQLRAIRTFANDYLLSLMNNSDFQVFPYLFIWNDFAYEHLDDGFFGVKWHRHFGEPEYRYDDPRCSKAIEEICRRNMPILLEEEFHNTVRFINNLALGVAVIIPHCGLLNGGYEKIKAEGLWELPEIHTDTALASMAVIEDFLTRYGSEKLIFGSDFPFGDPREELTKILNILSGDENVMRMITRDNILRLFHRLK